MDLQKILTDALQKEIDAGRETGAQIAVMRDGKLIADVCLGNMGPGLSDRAVAPDTLFPVFSTGKAFISTAGLRFVERGLLQLDMPVRELWPEFACNGKESVTVRHIFMHRSGVCKRPYYRTFADLADWDLMRGRVAQAVAAFPPGTQTRYQTVNYSWLLGELLLKTDPKKRTLKAIIQDEAIDPYSTGEIVFGANDEELKRTGTLIPPVGQQVPENPPPWDYSLTEMMNDEGVRRLCLPGHNCLASARGMAAHFDALLRGEILAPEALAEARRDISTPGDVATHGLGYSLMSGGTHFGHGGYGGSFAGADVKTGLSFGYTRIQMGGENLRELLLALVSPDSGACRWDEKTGQLVK